MGGVTSIVRATVHMKFSGCFATQDGVTMVVDGSWAVVRISGMGSL